MSMGGNRGQAFGGLRPIRLGKVRGWQGSRGRLVLFPFGRASLPAMLEHWGRPACPGARIPQRDSHRRRDGPLHRQGSHWRPTQTRFSAFGEGPPSQKPAMGSPTPHHRSASPFPVPSISPPGRPNAFPASAGMTPCIGRGRIGGPFTPPRGDRDAPSRIPRLPFEQMPRSFGTYGHGPSCSLPSVVDRRPQRR
jgi:hypothetical protein